MTDFHHSTWHRARKEHTCGCLVPSRECPRLRKHKIAPGEVYQRVFGIFDGERYGVKFCRIHSAEVSALFLEFRDDHDDGVDYERVREEYAEYFQSGGRPMWLRCLHAIRKELRETRAVLEKKGLRK